MTEGSGEVEDEVIDLNKEPVAVERKRKRGKRNNSSDKGNGGSDALLQSGRVLRSRTVAMSDGEKQVITMEIVKMGDKDEGEVPEDEGEVPEDEDEGNAPVLRKRKKMKGRRGRPPKTEGKVEDPLVGRKKGRRGRPPKTEGKGGVSSVSYRKKDDKVMEQKKIDQSSNGAGRGRGRPRLKRKRGRPPKTENVNVELVVKEKKRRGRPPKRENVNAELVIKRKNAKRSIDHKKSENGGPAKKLKVGRNDLENGVVKQKEGAVECVDGKEIGLREQKQLVRDQIVAMLKKAGWTIEYRQRQSKDYQDAVYVDRDGKTHWSVTLAYRKLKERIDEGNGDNRDVSAFSPIPEETLSMLFRITEKGKKAGKKKNGVVKIIERVKKKVSSKSKSLDGTNKSRSNRGKKRTLLARKPRDLSDNDDYELYEGKRSLVSWMIDLGTVPLGGKVKYKRGRGRKILLGGRIMKEGICCDCCNIMHTIREFESHAKKSPCGNPYQHIYLDSGASLFQCLVDSWKKHVETDNIDFVCVDVEGDDPNDDTCNMCGDGGDLICCDSCPSTFHNGCLRIDIPSGDWNCVYCSCKFCGVDCGCSLTSDDDSDLSSELFTCRLCEEKFHAHCIKEATTEDFDVEGPSFCGKECLKILEQLQLLIGVRHELEDGFSYTVLQHRVVSGDVSLSGDSSRVESNSKLAVAFTVMDECFEPITDERSGTNMIHNVVYSCGSNIKRLNYNGFFTIILERGDDLVSAASIRIHGSQLAEMPFIGTRFLYRRQGMCSRLLTATEKVLSSLGVEKLVIPAISELNETWTKVFGFSPLEESKRHEMRYMSMIVFPGVDMLQKPLVYQTDSAATGSTNITTEHQNMQENPPSDSTTSCDVKTQNPRDAAAVKSRPDANDASTTESTEVQTDHQSTEKQQGDDIRQVAPSNSDISPEIEVHNSNKDAAIEVNVDESSDSGSHPYHLEKPKDNDPSLKADETDTCPNGILSEDAKTVN